METGIHIFNSISELFSGAAQRFCALAADAIGKRGSFHVAMAGGSTPAGMYRLLATPGFAKKLSWPDSHLYFGDERCVPPDDSNSNFRMIKETLLDNLTGEKPSVHRIMGELPPAEAAADYQQVLRQQLPRNSDGWPCFDLVLLGMGTDGHIASLFPDTPALHETEQSVSALYVEKLESWRITLTLPVINHARHIMLLVSGEKKADILRHIHHTSPCVAPLPIQMLICKNQVEWYLDKSAARQL
jgi:6-phosphogluconolactonase